MSETETRDAAAAVNAYLLDLANPETRAAYDQVMARDAAVPEQPDGIDGDHPGLSDAARAAERVLAYVSETGDGLYDIEGGAPLYGRDLESVAKAALAARPVLSREAVADLLLAHQGEWDDTGSHVTCDCGWVGPAGAGAYALHLADVLDGGRS